MEIESTTTPVDRDNSTDTNHNSEQRQEEAQPPAPPAQPASDTSNDVPAPDDAEMSEPPVVPVPYLLDERTSTQPIAEFAPQDVPSAGDWVHPAATPPVDQSTTTATTTTTPRGRAPMREIADIPPAPVRCINPASEINARLDTQVEVKVYPCNNSQSGGKKKSTSFTIKPEGVIIQGSNRSRSSPVDLGADYAKQIGRKLQRYELSDTRACQLLVTTHNKSFWVVPAPEAFSRHSGTCRLLGDRKHPPASHTLQVGDFLRVGSVGVVVIETHDGVENRVLSEEKIQKIMKDTTSSGGFLDLAETDGGELLCMTSCEGCVVTLYRNLTLVFVCANRKLG